MCPVEGNFGGVYASITAFNISQRYDGQGRWSSGGGAGGVLASAVVASAVVASH